MAAYEQIVAFYVPCGGVADSSDRRLLSSEAMAFIMLYLLSMLSRRLNDASMGLRLI